MIENKIYVAGGHEGPPLVFLASCEEYVPDLSGMEYESDLFPDKIELKQNYPNPFNPSTVISYQIPASLNPSKGGTLVTLKVYDILGSEVALLVNEEQPAGKYQVEFDASELSSGIYFYQLTAGEFIQTKKMVLIR
jgi:hypothetical protein